MERSLIAPSIADAAVLRAAILDYGKVTVKPPFLRGFEGVPGIEHYEAVCEEIIRLLRVERERRKLSKYAVSQRSGVSESMLSLVERDLRNPTLELMLRIADAIGADLPSLIKQAMMAIPQKGRTPISTRKPRSAPARR